MAVTKQCAISRKDSYLHWKTDVRSWWSAFRLARTAQQLTAPQVLLSVSPAPEIPCKHKKKEMVKTQDKLFLYHLGCKLNFETKRSNFGSMLFNRML
jgi:hypothetical protein